MKRQSTKTRIRPSKEMDPVQDGNSMPVKPKILDATRQPNKQKNSTQPTYREPRRIRPHIDSTQVEKVTEGA